MKSLLLVLLLHGSHAFVAPLQRRFQQGLQFSPFHQVQKPLPLSAVPEDASRVEISASHIATSPKDLTSLDASVERNGVHKPRNDTVDVDRSLVPPDASDILAIDPETIDFVTVNKSDVIALEQQGRAFVSMFRGSANYIANHRNTLAVYHIPGELMDNPNEGHVVRDLMNDIALTWLLGMKIVIVAGCRHQIDKRVPDREYHNGLGVTDKNNLRVVMEEAGYVRFEIERQLARALRLHGGHTAHVLEMDGNVVSGNFYSAQPFGILDGVDFKYTGFVRRVEKDKIRQVLNARDICLLTTLGVSPSGEVFNVNSEALAATVASSMEASKLIFFTEKKVVLKNKVHDKEVQHLRLSDARKLLNHYEFKIEKKGVIQMGPILAENYDRTVEDFLLRIGWATVALEQGVKRAHILAPSHGALIQELYTRDGSGTMISRDLYEFIRRANVNDVAGIFDLIQPLVKMGTLVERPKSKLEQDIDSYYLYTRDNLILACGQLKKFEDGFAEIGCLVVNSQYRSQGRGDAMLGYLERMCVMSGCQTIFVLSTQTMEWFVERGFEEVGVESLPPSRQATYNYSRASKIYLKRIDSDRDLDAAELWWNR